MWNYLQDSVITTVGALVLLTIVLILSLIIGSMWLIAETALEYPEIRRQDYQFCIEFGERIGQEVEFKDETLLGFGTDETNYGCYLGEANGSN